LKIYTTLDPDMQTAAEHAVSHRLTQVEQRPGYPHATKASGADEYLQGALLAMDNRTGGIRAVVGGRDYSDSNNHRAFDALRQAGSTVKPFVFATAFAHGVKPTDTVSDNRLRPGEISARLGRYDPSNSDNQYRGDIRVADALIDSRIPPASAWACAPASPPRLTRWSARAQRSRPHFPSLCLGSFETTLKDLTAAYTAFPNDRCPSPPSIEKV